MTHTVRKTRRLIGLIDASSPGGCRRSRGWRLVLHLAAWRSGKGLEVGARRCELPLSERRAIERWRARIGPYQVISMEVSKVTPQLTCVRKILRTNLKDLELERVARALRKPVRIKAKPFGVLTLDRRYGWYAGNTRWRGKKVALTLAHDVKALATAEALFSAPARWTKRLHDFVAEQLLAQKNDDWLSDDERELTKPRFLARLTLEAISVERDGEFTFFFNDGEMFCGHTIAVSGSIHDGLAAARLSG